MLSNLKVFTDKVYKKMKRLIEETDDHDLQDLKQAFKSHKNKYVLHIRVGRVLFSLRFPLRLDSVSSNVFSVFESRMFLLR